MTKDEELKDAREWWGNSTDDFPECDHDLAKLLAAYHHHRLDTAWVSVKERLPENSERVFVAIENDFVLLVGQYVCGQWCVYYSDGIKSPIFNFVTHWQPLPEPPKETK